MAHWGTRPAENHSPQTVSSLAPKRLFKTERAHPFHHGNRVMTVTAARFDTDYDVDKDLPILRCLLRVPHWNPYAL